MISKPNAKPQELGRRKQLLRSIQLCSGDSWARKIGQHLLSLKHNSREKPSIPAQEVARGQTKTCQHNYLSRNILPPYHQKTKLAYW